MGNTRTRLAEPTTISVNGRSLGVEGDATAADILNMMGDSPQNKTLMMMEQDGTYVPVKPNQQIRTVNGGRFHSILNQTGGQETA